MNKSVFLTVLVLAVAGMLTARAEEGAKEQRAGKRGEGKKRNMDPAVRDGKRFADADTNRDGVLSLAEFTVMHEAMLAKMKERAGDQADAERAAKRPDAETVFKKLDADNSGTLTPAEAAARRQKREQRRERRDGEKKAEPAVGT